MKALMNKGFTLIEIMLAMAIIAIIAAVAIPAYSSYSARGKIVDAQSGLTLGRMKMEQWYQDKRTYADATGSACGAIPTTSDYFSYSCTLTSPTAYTMTATNLDGKGLGTAGSYVFTINQNNAKATTTFAGKAKSLSCWMLKSGDTC